MNHNTRQCRENTQRNRLHPSSDDFSQIDSQENTRSWLVNCLYHDVVRHVSNSSGPGLTYNSVKNCFCKFKVCSLKTSYCYLREKIFWERFVNWAAIFRICFSEYKFCVLITELFHRVHSVAAIHWDVRWIFCIRFDWPPFLSPGRKISMF